MVIQDKILHCLHRFRNHHLDRILEEFKIFLMGEDLRTKSRVHNMWSIELHRATDRDVDCF